MGIKIYVASSWRNDYQPEVVQRLRDDGHQVYDFKGPGDGWGTDGEGPGGFGWKEVDPDWQTWPEDIPRYLQGLKHPRATEGFNRDMDALIESDACVMVMPCGPSASMEMGFAVGAGKFVVVYIPAMREPDLMVCMADLVTTELASVLSALRTTAATSPPIPPARRYCLHEMYEASDDPIRCQRRKGHSGPHSMFPVSGDWPVPRA